MTTAQRILYGMELFVTALFLLLLIALGFISWWGCLGAFVAFVLGMSFAIVNFYRRELTADFGDDTVVCSGGGS